MSPNRSRRGSNTEHTPLPISRPADSHKTRVKRKKEPTWQENGRNCSGIRRVRRLLKRANFLRIRQNAPSDMCRPADLRETRVKRRQEPTRQEDDQNHSGAGKGRKLVSVIPHHPDEIESPIITDIVSFVLLKEKIGEQFTHIPRISP